MDYNDLRVSERKIWEEKINGQKLRGIVNIGYFSRIEAGISIGRTIFVCLVLGVGALTFAKDANDLVLTPIERMIDRVNRIARNPISSKEVNLIQHSGKI
jgi:hypothetical protein